MTAIVDVTVRGTAPLLQHRFAEGDKMNDDAPIRKSGKKSYESEALNSLYLLEGGIVFQPSSHIEGAIQKAAVNFQIGGRGKKTYKDLTKSALLVSPECIRRKIQEYEIDRRAVIVNRARVMRERPMFREWELDFEIHLLDPQLKPEAVRTILEHAGAYVGIGDYRPKFGRFSVLKFDV